MDRLEELTKVIAEHSKEETVPVPMELAVWIAFELEKMRQVRKALDGE